MKPLISLLVGALVGFGGYKLLGGGEPPKPPGLGLTRFFPYKTDFDTANRARAIMQSLAGVPPGLMAGLGDMPNTYYGGDTSLPSFGGDPTFLTAYDPEGPYPFYGWGGPTGHGDPQPPA